MGSLEKHQTVRLRLRLRSGYLKVSRGVEWWRRRDVRSAGERFQAF